MARNPRRAYDEHGREIEPMTLGNMREHGVRSVDTTYDDCRHEATPNVDALLDASMSQTWRSGSRFTIKAVAA